MFYDNLNPVILNIGIFQVRWYGLMYIIGITLVWLFIKKYHKSFGVNFKKNQLNDLIFYIVLGLLIGGRLGYVIFYNFHYFWTHPMEILQFWHGGMSFHGGLMVGILAVYLYAKYYKINFLKLADLIAVPLPIALACGRIGNFINGELWGRPWNGPWAFIFKSPYAGNIPRHPSQIYEFLKNLTIFGTLFYFFKKTKPKPGMLASGFLLLYGILRITIEFFREPEIVWHGVTMGQWLSIPLVLFGAYGLWKLSRK